MVLHRFAPGHADCGAGDRGMITSTILTVIVIPAI
jgi:hypothetical protein